MLLFSDDDLIRSGDEDDEYFPSDEADEFDSDGGSSYFEEEETKSRFTNYSLTSSVIRRNEGKDLLTLWKLPKSRNSL